MAEYKIKYTFIDDIVADTKEKAIEIFENFVYNTEHYDPDIVTIEENEDAIQKSISFYENKFNNLIEEIESDTVLKTIEGNHLAGILVQMKKQIDKYLKENEDESN